MGVRTACPGASRPPEFLGRKEELEENRLEESCYQRSGRLGFGVGEEKESTAQVLPRAAPGPGRGSLGTENSYP